MILRLIVLRYYNSLEWRNMPVYLIEDMCSSVLISMFFVAKSKPSSTECSLQMVCSINEKHGIVELVYLSEFIQESFCQHGRNR